MNSKKLKATSADVKNKYRSSSAYILETMPKLEENIVRQIETIRVSEKLSIQDFAELIGVPYSTYNKITYLQRKLSLGTFIAVCRLFGYDISKLVGESYLNSSDSVFRELAMFLGQIQPDTINAMLTALLDSSEDSATKERGKILFDALERVVGDTQQEPFYLFAQDKPKNISEDSQ